MKIFLVFFYDFVINNKLNIIYFLRFVLFIVLCWDILVEVEKELNKVYFGRSL